MPLVKPKALLLGPGGVKGFMEIGTLLALGERQWLDEVETYVGVSIGSIISLLLVCGFQPTEIISQSLDVDIFQGLGDFDLQKTKEEHGICGNTFLRMKLEEMVQSKFGVVPTLRGLYMATGKTLIAVSVNLDKNEPVYFSKETEPELSCIDAVMMSSNIPLLFYRLTHRGAIHADGALAAPYPIHLVDDGQTPVLGIRIVPRKASMKDKSFSQYLYAVIHVPIDQIERRAVREASPMCDHITLISSTRDSVGFDLKLRDKCRMILDGYLAGLAYLPKIERKSHRARKE